MPNQTKERLGGVLRTTAEPSLPKSRHGVRRVHVGSAEVFSEPLYIA